MTDEDIIQLLPKEPNRMVISLIGCYPWFQKIFPSMAHEEHPFIYKCLNNNIQTTVILIDPSYKDNSSPMCNNTFNKKSTDYYDTCYKYYGKLKYYIITVKKNISHSEMIKLDDYIISQNQLHFITYYTGFENVLGKPYHPRRYEANGGCMLSWSHGLSTQEDKYNIIMSTDKGYFLPHVNTNNFTFSRYELNITSLYNIMKIYESHPDITPDIVDWNYYIGCVKLLLFYMTLETLPFRGFSSSIIDGIMDLCPKAKIIDSANPKCNFNKCNNKIHLIMSIYTLLYRRNLIQKLDGEQMFLNQFNIDMEKLIDDNSNKYVLQIVHEMINPKLEYNQKIITSMIIDWIKSDVPELKDFWYCQMNNLCQIIYKITNHDIQCVNKPLIEFITELEKQLQLIIKY